MTAPSDAPLPSVEQIQLGLDAPIHTNSIEIARDLLLSAHGGNAALLTDGVRAVSSNTVLGDPTSAGAGAGAEQRYEHIRRLAAAVVRYVDEVFPALVRRDVR